MQYTYAAQTSLITSEKCQFWFKKKKKKKVVNYSKLALPYIMGLFALPSSFKNKSYYSFFENGARYEKTKAWLNWTWRESRKKNILWHFNWLNVKVPFAESVRNSVSEVCGTAPSYIQNYFVSWCLLSKYDGSKTLIFHVDII